MNTRSLAKMGPWEQSGHISLVPTLWRRHQRKKESCLDYIFCQGEVAICGCWLSTWRRGRQPAGIYIQPWKWPLGPLTCGMNALPYKSPHCECLNIPNWSPNRPFEFYERSTTTRPSLSHVKDCDNICGPKLCAHQYLPKICRQYLSVWQSSICLSCSPIRSRQSYFVWRHADRESRRSICSLLQHKTIWIWNVLKMMFFSNWFPFKVKIVRRRNLLKNSWPL